jgi:hypothetical protein
LARSAEAKKEIRTDIAQARTAIELAERAGAAQFSADELTFLERDLRTHAAQPVKFIVSHRPSWLFGVMVGNTQFPLHQLAKKYGVQYVIAGHVHQMLHLDLDGVAYLSMASSGGHLRASKKYEDGWFFGLTVVEVRGDKVRLGIEAPSEVPVHRQEVLDAMRRNSADMQPKMPPTGA